MGNKKLIPELRFPEFVKDGEWEEKSLGEIGEFIGGGTPDTSIAEYWNGEIQWLTPTEIKHGVVKKSLRTITDKGLQSSSARLLPSGTILITTRATIGDVCITTEPCTTNQGFQSLIVKKEQHNIFWYYWLIQHKNELTRKASGSTFPEIGKNEIIAIISLSPQIAEQQKIASCLSSLDEVIGAHSQKLDALKDHKKGLMQNLFPQQGETVPKFRFKEFMNDGEWKEKSLGSIAEIITGNTPNTNEPINYNGNNLFVSPADISNHRFITHTKTTLSDIGFSRTRQIKAHSILFVCIGSTIGKIAQNKFECATNQQINSLIPYEGNSNDFLYSILENNSSKISSIAGNHAIPMINKTSFSSIKLCFPPEQPEQQKIADCLSSLDALITSQKEKIEALKLHKKALMQRLFPKVTGS